MKDVRVSELNDVPVAEYAPAEPCPAGHRSSSRWGKGFLALSGSFLLPGLGQLLAGRTRRALFCFALYALFNALGFAAIMVPSRLPAIIVLAPVGTVCVLWIYLDSFLCGRRSSRRLLGRPFLRYGGGVLLIAAAVGLDTNTRVAYYVRDHYVEALSVAGSAMSPALAPGDRFLLHKRVTWERWSAVVVNHPQYGAGVPVASRIVGVPGETIEIASGKLRVDGHEHTPPPGVGPYTSVTYPGRLVPSLAGEAGAGCTGNPITLGEDEYFVLGDNSGAALDARLWEVAAAPGRQLGALPADQIRGRVTAIYWPPSRWRRFGE